jgi:chromosome segregation ATPase
MIALLLLIVTPATSLSFDVMEAKVRPVTKIVNLLNSMQEQLEKEAKDDAKAFEDYQCWCRVNGDEKLKKALEVDGRIKAMTAQVDELTAISARLQSEFTSLGDDIKKFQEAIDSTDALRMKTEKQFTQDETDLLSHIANIDSAINSIKSGAGKAGKFLQLSGAASATLRQLISEQSTLLSETRLAKIESFVEQPSVAGTPKSDAALGVLNDLRVDFTQKLKSLRANHTKDDADYILLIKAKKDEKDAARAQIEAKKQQKADADEEVARTNQDIKETRAAADEDIKFANEVIAKCAVAAEEYQQRTQTRTDETAAISKAISILDADEAHAQFAKTLSFMQESSSNGARDRAIASLLAIGKKHDTRLVTLAMQMKIDSFVRVKKAIDDMITALKQEQAGEVKQKDLCVAQFQRNKLTTEKKTRTKAKKDAKVADLELKVKQVADQISQLEGQIKELQEQLKIASQNREQENKEFQEVVTDQRESQVLLQKALAVLAQFYAPNSSVLVEIHSAPTEPKLSSGYKKKAEGTGVTGMLQQLIYDTKAMEVEATEAEKTAQETYETAVKETSNSIDRKTQEIRDKTDNKASLETALVESNESAQGTQEELSALADVNKDLHESCDFIMKNFDLRQQARIEETGALNQAKSFLSGAKLLQTA